jgi:hypothetical protein
MTGSSVILPGNISYNVVFMFINYDIDPYAATSCYTSICHKMEDYLNYVYEPPVHGHYFTRNHKI